MKHVKLHSRTWSASLLALVILTLLPSCGNEARPSRPGAAGLQIHLVFQEKSAASTAGTASVQTIRVSAWEVPGGATPRVLRGSTSATIAAGDTRFRLELQIPPAALYLLQVEAEGILGTPANPTRNGLLFLGSENIADVVAGETRSVEIVLHRTVPVLVGQAVRYPHSAEKAKGKTFAKASSAGGASSAWLAWYRSTIRWATVLALTASWISAVRWLACSRMAV